MAAKSQELIGKLLAAEESAEKIIQNAREQRQRKLRDVRLAAEEELEPFRKKEEEKFMAEQAQATASEQVTAQLEKQTQMELAAVKSDYEANKKTAIKYILDKVLDIDLSVPESVVVAMTKA
jgi:V-type H+-transporting ATPase subunit G